MGDLFMAQLTQPKLPDIIEGAIYKIRRSGGDIANYKAVKKYDKYVKFQAEQGYYECFTYWDLERCLCD